MARRSWPESRRIKFQVAIIPSKQVCNKIAGLSTHLMKWIQKGPVRSISLKLQVEEHERRMDFVPEQSAINVSDIEVDKETMDMLSALGMTDIPGTKQVDLTSFQSQQTASAAMAPGGTSLPQPEEAFTRDNECLNEEEEALELQSGGGVH